MVINRRTWSTSLVPRTTSSASVDIERATLRQTPVVAPRRRGSATQGADRERRATVLGSLTDVRIGRRSRPTDDAVVPRAWSRLARNVTAAALSSMMSWETIVRDWSTTPESTRSSSHTTTTDTSCLRSDLSVRRSAGSGRLEGASREPSMASARTSGERDARGMSGWMSLRQRSSKTPLSIAFAYVATHNHFVLDRGRQGLQQSAPVIKLPAEATEDEHLQLLGLAQLVRGLLLDEAGLPQQGKTSTWRGIARRRSIGTTSMSSMARS